LAERIAETEHARRALAPVRDDFLAIRALQIEVPEDAELVRVAPHRLDRVGVDGIAKGTRRMDYRAIDPGRLHLRERLVVRVRGVLAMVRAHLPVLPDMDLGVDYQHLFLRSKAVMGQASGAIRCSARMTPDR